MGKICTVKEVYIPPETVTGTYYLSMHILFVFLTRGAVQGLHRGFAIVELDADMSLVRKCKQMGAPILLALASMYNIILFMQVSNYFTIRTGKAQNCGTNHVSSNMPLI
jgi:hypothetical protein